MRTLPGIGSHHSARRMTDEWLTPPSLLQQLGPFDLDPCAPIARPWDTAARHFTVEDDGLSQPWAGRVWCNPPYSDAAAWLERLAAHGEGTALLFARCETATWRRHVWPHASALLFLAGRVTFHRGDGTASRAGHNAGGPSVLVAYGPADAALLARSGLAGALVAGAIVLP